MNHEARLDAWFDRVSAAAPTFTDEQVANLRPLFHPHTVAPAVSLAERRPAVTAQHKAAA